MDIMSSIGILIIAGISITIQLLNTFPTDSRGLIQTPGPLAFNRMTYASNKYLNGVGIFAAWPLDASSTDDFIWLADITQVVNNSLIQVNIQTDYDVDPLNYTLCFTQQSKSSCFAVVNRTMSKMIADESSTAQLLSNLDIANNGYQIGIAREPAQPFTYKIGYLDYNLNRFDLNETSKSCEPVKTSLSCLERVSFIN